jgi:ubiquinone/menaquinone biosynthesis C-methylase UbiE
MGSLWLLTSWTIQYLVESIRQFPPQDEFKSMMEAAGFQRTSYTNYTHGVVAVHSGFKL